MLVLRDIWHSGITTITLVITQGFIYHVWDKQLGGLCSSLQKFTIIKKNIIFTGGYAQMSHVGSRWVRQIPDTGVIYRFNTCDQCALPNVTPSFRVRTQLKVEIFPKAGIMVHRLFTSTLQLWCLPL